MPLNKLENFIKNTEGRILYVNPSDLDATDSISNQGNSLAQPFKTIQRALLESARFSYVEGNNNDLIEKTTILLFPGEHIVDNRPGFGIKEVGNSAKAIAPDGSGSNGAQTEATETLSLNLTSVFDLTQEDNILYKFNSIHGGVIVPRGTSLVGLDLRKTKVKPKYVPNPLDDTVASTALFRITGTCYFWQFSIFDGDESGLVFTDSSDFTAANQSKPTFSHHKLTCFEYADGVNIDDRFNLTDLAIYYSKLSNAFNSTARPIDSLDRFPDNNNGLAPQRPEFEIVGAFGSDPITISDIISGDSTTPTSIITVTTASDHGLTTGTPIKIRGVDDLRYNLSTKVQNVTGLRTFTYLLPFVPDDLAANPGTTAGTVTIETDTVSGASPYIFNISLRSVYGMNGMHADGSKATGFRSMVVAQFTAISLQKDDRAFVKYDQESRTYKGIIPSPTPPRGSELATLSSSQDASKVYHLDSDAVYRKGFETTHIKLSNDAIMQIVSVFAIGFNKHFNAETGADASITNSNSNFGQFAIASDGFKKDAFGKDDATYITHILAPKEITSPQTNVDWQRINVDATKQVGITTHLYLFGFDTLDNVPPTVIQGYRVGAASSDRLFVDFTNATNGAVGLREATVRMTGGTGDDSSVKSYKVTAGPTNNVFTIGAHQLQTGEKIRILSDSADLPENLEENTIYFAIVVAGSPTNQIKLASSKTNADNDVALTVYGGTKLKIESRVSDKAAGDIGSPLQFDSGTFTSLADGSTKTRGWYLLANPNSEIYDTINVRGVTGTNGLGENTPVSFIKRTADERSLDEKIYKLRVVVPKESTNAKNPEEGFILQESSTTGITSTNAFDFTSISQSDVAFKRNYRFISTCSESSDTVTVVSVAPHDLKVGERIFVRNCKDNDANGTSTGVFNKGFNGSFTVASIVDDKTFTYNAKDTDGVTHSIGDFTSDTTTNSSRTGAAGNVLPRFERNDSKSNFYIYRNETITPYIKDTQDGIYHLFVLHADNSITEEFTDLKYGQNVVDLYPQLDRDNNHSNPPSAVSFAKRNPLGDVATDDLRKSITRETTDKIIKDLGYGKRVTGVTTSFPSANVGVATITFDRPHGFASIKAHSTISAGGSGYTASGTFHNIKLFDEGTTNWRGARASVTTNGSGTVTDVTITEGGSGYNTVGSEVLDIDRQFIGGSSATQAKITIVNSHNGNTGISTNIGDTLQLTGVGTATDGLYRIASVPSSTTVSVALTATTPRPQIDQYAIIVAPSIEIASESFSVDTTTFTTIKGHGLISGQKFNVLDANNQNLGSFFVKTKVSATSFTAVTTVDLGTPKFILSEGVASATPLSDKENENVGSRGLSFYDGDFFFLNADATNSTILDVKLPNESTLTSDAAILARFPLGTYFQAGDEIMRRSSAIAPAAGKISVIRSVFGTPQQNHLSGDPIRVVTPKAIELRRPSIIRASGHTFEYLGFGPGNYSTALPQVQVRTLSEREEFLVQSQERSCGTVVYTGMNNRGDFFIGNKRVSSATGQERTFDAPIATVTGEDPSRLSVIFDEVIIKERLVVEGGKSNTILTQFDGPVTFNKLVKLNDDLTVNGIMKLNNTFEITDTTQSTSKDTGAFVVEGGIGVEKNLNVGGNLGVSGDFSIDGITQSTSTTTGALVVDGGVGIAKNVNIGGNITGAGDISADGNLTIKGNTTLGDTNSDTHTFNGLVSLNHGIDIENIDIGGSDPNTITTDAGDLVLDAASGQSVQVNKNLSVSGNISGNRLDIDNVRIDGNTVSCTQTNSNLNLSANGTGIVDVQDTLEVTKFKIHSDSNIYTSIDTDLSSVSSNDDSLASAKAIKGYVDSEISAIDTKITISDGATSDQVTIGTDTLTFAGTSNEVNTAVSDNQVTIGLPDDVTIGSDLTVTDNLVVNGNTTLGDTFASDTLTLNSKISSSLVPSANDTHSLGNSNNKWKNLFLSGTGNVESLVASTVAIHNGTINNTTIGITTAASGKFTRVDVDDIRLDGNDIITTNTNVNLTLNPNGTGQTVIQSNLDVNGDLDVSGDCQLGNGSGDTVTIPSILDVNGRADIDNIRIDGNTISAQNTNGDITLLPNGNSGSAGSVIVGNQNHHDLLVKGDIIAFHSSDKTLKENITRIPNALDKVASLSGNTYTWIKGHKYEGQNDTGVIAQEVEALDLPGLTITKDGGMKAVRYEKLIPVLIEAIKELKAEIDILKK